MNVCFVPENQPAWGGQRRADIVVMTEDGDTTTERISFSVPKDFFVHGDSLATALATLCGKTYRGIRFAFPVSDFCLQTIATHCGCSVEAEGRVDRRRPGSAIGLGFSGGFDSLAAHLLAPGKMRLISADFGTGFERERSYFSRHDPDITCVTDFRQKGFAANDWRFMGAPALLHADYLDLGTLAFGSILEATVWNFSPRASQVSTTVDPLFKAAGLEEGSPLRGLTELGTAMVIHRRRPEEFAPSLASLANAGTEKLFRKTLIVDAIRHLHGGPAPDFSSYSYPRRPTPWGTAFTVDLLALYFWQTYGGAAVAPWVSGMEALDLGWLKQTSLNFYTRVNPNFIPSIPEAIRVETLQSYADCAILPYNEEDWQAFSRVRSFLGQFHQIPT